MLAGRCVANPVHLGTRGVCTTGEPSGLRLVGKLWRCRFLCLKNNLRSDWLPWMMFLISTLLRVSSSSLNLIRAMSLGLSRPGLSFVSSQVSLCFCRNKEICCTMSLSPLINCTGWVPMVLVGSCGSTAPGLLSACVTRILGELADRPTESFCRPENFRAGRSGDDSLSDPVLSVNDDCSILPAREGVWTRLMHSCSMSG